MFERIVTAASRRAEERAGSKRAELAEAIGAGAPRGIEVSVEGEHVVLSGRGLARRWIMEPALRWLAAGMRDGR